MQGGFLRLQVRPPAPGGGNQFLRPSFNGFKQEQAGYAKRRSLGHADQQAEVPLGRSESAFLEGKPGGHTAPFHFRPERIQFRNGTGHAVDRPERTLLHDRRFLEMDAGRAAPGPELQSDWWS